MEKKSVAYIIYFFWGIFAVVAGGYGIIINSIVGRWPGIAILFVLSIANIFMFDWYKKVNGGEPDFDYATWLKGYIGFSLIFAIEAFMHIFSGIFIAKQ